MPSSETNFAVAVDIGGTFTDISLMDRGSGQVWRAKTPSIPADPSEAFMAGVRTVLADAQIEPGILDQVLHGTTVATNMILEGKRAKTALITTQGFRHVLAIGRQDIPRKANLFFLGQTATPGACLAHYRGRRTGWRRGRGVDGIGRGQRVCSRRPDP